MLSNTLSFFLTGLWFGSGPCIASCGPLLVSYIAGNRKGIAKGISAYFLFSAARVAVYLALALAVFFLGKFILESWLGRFSKYLFILAGIFLVILGGLIAAGRDLKSHCGEFLNRKLLTYDRKSIILMGLLIGILPCAPLLALFGTLGLISKTWMQAVLYTFFFSLGTVVSPLLILSACAGFIPKFLSGNKEAYSKILSFICGLIVIFLGIQLIIRAYA